MNKKIWVFAVVVLVIASLACSVLSGGGAKPTQAPSDGGVEATSAPAGGGDVATVAPAGDGNNGYKTEFPLPDGISNFTDLGNGAINFQVKMSIKDTIAFYREAFTKAGYKERTINTAITDTTFSLVFDGHASGKAIVIQGVDLGGSTNVNIRFEDV